MINKVPDAILADVKFMSLKERHVIIEDTYGKVVWFRGGKREVVKLKEKDSYILTCKILAERFWKGVPFHPKACLSKIKELPDIYIGKIEGIPLVINAKSSGECNMRVNKILDLVSVYGVEDLNIADLLGSHKARFEKITELLKQQKQERQAIAQAKREAFMDKCYEDTLRWYQIAQKVANDYASNEHYKMNRAQKYEKLLSVL